MWFWMGSRSTAIPGYGLSLASAGALSGNAGRIAQDPPVFACPMPGPVGMMVFPQTEFTMMANAV